MGQPREPLIREWADLDAFRPPDPDDPARFAEGSSSSPALWREFWKPRYRRQFDLVHGEGLDVYFHCYGAVAELILGLIGYIEEYGSIGLSEENYQACIDAFHDIGAGR